MSVFDGAASQRRALGAALRALRQTTGLSGLAFSKRVDLKQSKVSRVELGQTVPSIGDLNRWLDATNAPEERRAQLHTLRAAAAVEAKSWPRHRSLDAIQAEVKAMEAAAIRIREFHPVLVPGLLQAPAYARAVAEARHGAGHPDVARWVQAVMDRQALLHEPGRRFEFVIGEGALRWWPGPAAAAGQLDRLRLLAELPNVTLGILPFGEVTVWRSHHFTMFDLAEEQSLVHLELLATGDNLRDPDHIARYDEAFTRLRDVAVVGEDARALLARIASDL